LNTDKHHTTALWRCGDSGNVDKSQTYLFHLLKRHTQALDIR